MQPQQPQPQSRAGPIQSHSIITMRTSGNKGGEGESSSRDLQQQQPWSLVSGFPKDRAEAWTAMGGVGGVGTCIGNIASNNSSLSKIYLPPHQQDPPQNTEGIVVRALNVVSDESSRSLSLSSSSVGVVGSEAVCWKKIAKKRRKQNGGVDIEHTKSSKEFLRKAQQSLKELALKEKQSQDQVRSTMMQPNQHPIDRRRRLLYTKQSKACPTVDDNSETTSTTDSSTPSSSRSSNPYGYEDPDSAVAGAAPIQVRRVGGPARRRGSFTKYSPQAVKAAAAATEKIRQLQQSRKMQQQISPAQHQTSSLASSLGAAAIQRLQSTKVLSSSSSLPNDNTAARIASAMASKQQPLPEGEQQQHGRRPIEKSSSGSSRDSRDAWRHRNRRMGERANSEHSGSDSFGGRNVPQRTRSGGKKETVRSRQYQETPQQQVQDSFSRGSMPPPKVNSYRHEDSDTKQQQPQIQTSISNPYGYEDKVMAVKEPAPPKNPYGYEDPPAKPNNPYGYGDDVNAQPRPRRRHRAVRRGSVTKFSLDATVKVRSSAAEADLTPTSYNKPIVPMAVDNLIPNNGLSDLLQPTPTPWAIHESLKTQRPSAFDFSAGRGTNLMGRTSSSSLRSASVARSESFRSNPDNALAASESSDSEESLHDDRVDDMVHNMHHMPPAPPSRHDSWRSYASKRSDSLRSLESDASSLAPDMQSLCSISKPTGASDDGPPPPLPAWLPGTPTPLGAMRKSLKAAMASATSTTPKTLSKQQVFV